MRIWVVLTLVLLALPTLNGCTSAGADVSRAELAAVVERDGLSFEDSDIPADVIDQLAGSQVIVLGETHHLREHWAFVAALVRALHERGVRQLLIESPQMADWLFDGYVTGGTLEPTYELPAFYARQLEAIREFNDTLPSDERVHVRLIDVNEEHHGGAAAFADLFGFALQRLERYEPAEAFLAIDFASEPIESDAIRGFLSSLEADREELISAWGEDWYARVLEMVEVEQASIRVRAARRDDDRRAVEEREAMIKRLVDARLSDYAERTMINIGSTHAQKSYLRGTEIEWLGEYLTRRAERLGGVICVDVTAATIELEPGASGSAFSVVESSPEHELFRVIAESSDRRNVVFLPLSDPLFKDRTVAINYEDRIYVASPRRHYDAVLLFGIAHRMPDN